MRLRVGPPCTLTAACAWLAAILSLDLIMTVLGIKCLQCTSLVDRECESGHMAAKACEVYDQYCIKYTAESDNFVFRSCSQVVMRNCERKQVVDDIWMQVCFHTCDTDGCNTAMTVTSRPPSLVILLMTLLCVCVFSFLTT